MRKSRILLHTARYEGQGYVFLEALASGMRVVCRDVGYTGDAPAVFRCKSNEEMADVMREMLASPVDDVKTNVLGIDYTVRAFEELYWTPK